MGHGDEEPGLPHRGPRVRRAPRLRGDRRDRRRPARGRPLLRRRRPDPLARRWPTRPSRSGSSTRSTCSTAIGRRPSGCRPASSRGRRSRRDDRRDGRRRVPDGARQPAASTTTCSRSPGRGPGRDRPADLPDPDRDRRTTAELIADFERLFAPPRPRPASSRLFEPRRTRTSTGSSCEQDAVYVTGGNTANLLALWRLHGLDRASAGWDAGVVHGRDVGRRDLLVRVAARPTRSGRRSGRSTAGSGSSTGASSRTTTARRSGGRCSAGWSATATLPAGYAVDDGAALVFRGPRRSSRS